MKKILRLMSGLAVVSFLFAGCASMEDSVSAADLTLTELEKKMQAATDPQGIFARSKTYVLLQQVSTKKFLSEPEENLVEVKFERPDKFRLTTYEDNKPVSMWCSDGQRGWIADYSSRKIKMLDGAALRRMTVMAQISNPQESYSKIFSKVQMFSCVNESGKFYRIDCYGENQTSPISIYVDAVTFLVKRMKFTMAVGSGQMSYDAIIRKYELREGVMIPVETEISQNGETQTSKITSYRLNVPIPETDFIPPVF
jgi:outer membrane lipoprotein-sorting protein